MKRKEFEEILNQAGKLSREEKIELISELNILTYGYAETILMENILFRYNNYEYWEPDLIEELEREGEM